MLFQQSILCDSISFPEVGLFLDSGGFRLPRCNLLILSGQSKEDSWYPRAKVETARKKLELGNPSEILRDELKENVHVGKEQAFWHVATGSRKLHARARVGAVCKSVDEQVMCLIELATDLNMLGRQYVGLATWL